MAKYQMTKRRVRVFRDGKLVGDVSAQSTGVGAAKLAGTRTAKMERVREDGQRASYGETAEYAWIAFD